MKGLGCSAATYNPLLPQREKRKAAQPSDYDKSELLEFGGGCALNIFGRVKFNDIENHSEWTLEKLGAAPAQNLGEIDSVPASAESRTVSSLVTPASSKTSGQFHVEIPALMSPCLSHFKLPWLLSFGAEGEKKRGTSCECPCILWLIHAHRFFRPATVIHQQSGGSDGLCNLLWPPDVSRNLETQ